MYHGIEYLLERVKTQSVMFSVFCSFRHKRRMKRKSEESSTSWESCLKYSKPQTTLVQLKYKDTPIIHQTPACISCSSNTTLNLCILCNSTVCDHCCIKRYNSPEVQIHCLDCTI
jgi:hypothetical protein